MGGFHRAARANGGNMSEILEVDDDIIRDFRKDKLRWGWNILLFHMTGDKTAKVTGIGKGVEEGNHILVTLNDSSPDKSSDYGCRIDSIEYESDPKDMFNAEVSIMGIVDE